MGVYKTVSEQIREAESAIRRGVTEPEMDAFNTQEREARMQKSLGKKPKRFIGESLGIQSPVDDYFERGSWENADELENS